MASRAFGRQHFRQLIMMEAEDLANRFTYHTPKGDQAIRYEQIRDAAHDLAGIINERTPDSREKSLAITHLEDAVMWANASIARNELWPARAPGRISVHPPERPGHLLHLLAGTFPGDRPDDVTRVGQPEPGVVRHPVEPQE